MCYLWYEDKYEKNNFFAINVRDEDKEALKVDRLTVLWCNRYVYLGSIFTSDGSVSSAIAAHASAKMCQILKFVSFIRKNIDIPFYVKRRIFDAALMSSILYGCESWINGSLRPVEKLYNWGIKQLLGVRMTTCNDLCYAELGVPPLKALVMMKQRKFFKSMWNERQHMIDDPLAFAIRTTLNANISTSQYVSQLINQDINDVAVAKELLHRSIRLSQSSRRITYKLLNPSLEIPSAYHEKQNVNEVHRISYTQFRLSGHKLAVETGRWNRRGRGRLPMEERLCPCGQIQTELHVIEDCPLTSEVRRQYAFNSWQNLQSPEIGDGRTVKIVHMVLSIFGT